VVTAFAPGGRGFDSRQRHTKGVIKIVPDASLLGAQRKKDRPGFSLPSNLVKKEMDNWIPSGMSGRE